MTDVAPSRAGPFAPRRSSEDAGFSLVELLVVLLIIGILLAIAIPTFLAVTKSSNDTAAQANLYTTLTGAKTYFLGNGQSYTDFYDKFGSVDTGISDVTASTGPSGPHIVSIDVLSDSALVMTAYGPGTPDCWGIVDLTDSQTSAVLGLKGAGTLYFEDKHISTTACQADNFTASTPVDASGNRLLVSKSGFSSVS